jgi:alanyl-tRNA synthetase
LDDYGQKHMIVTQLATRLTTGGSELDASVERLQDENKEMRRMLKRQQIEIGRLQASHYIDQALRIGDTLIVAEVLPDCDPGQLRAVSSQLIREEGVIALLGAAGDRSHLLFSRSERAPGQMNRLLKSALGVLGSKSGGGSAAFAQGVGPPASDDLVLQAIEAAKNQLLEEIGSMR